MNDTLLHTLLQKTGKARFVDWAEHCLDLGKTSDIIEIIRTKKEYGYTKKSYETRVHNIKTIIKAGRLSDALLIIIESDRLEQSTLKKAIDLLDITSFDGQFPNPYINLTSPGGDRLASIKIRLGQNRFRKALIQKWQGCSITGYKETSILVASHIKPWRLSDPEEKVNPENGLLLLPNLDKAFDKGLISFNPEGLIMISSKLVAPETLGVSKNLFLSMSKKCSKFMEFHRNNIFC